MRFNIINKAVVWVMLGIILIFTSIYLFFSNLNLSKDFTGWLEIKISEKLNDSQVKQGLENLLKQNKFKKVDIMVSVRENITDILLKTTVSDDQKVNKLTSLVKSWLLENYLNWNNDKILQLSVVWPSFGDYIKNSAKWAIIWGIILMSVYILFAFIWIREYISPFLLAGITVLTMLFDISIPSGAYWLLMHFNSTVQVDVIFVIAILTIMWYSINDTIVIFDRVREELQRSKLTRGNKDFEKKYAEIFEKSLWATMRRSLGTSISTFLVVLALYIFGTGVIKLFAFTMGIWIIAGTYSSIFFAAPLAYLLTKK